jgi:glycosyltransferase involved in cell wall biosynthesis
MHRLIRALISKIPLLRGYRLLRVSDIARLQRHNQLLTDAATESAANLQRREAMFAEFATQSAVKFEAIQHHNQLLIEAATESARKLQEREAEFIILIAQQLQELQQQNRLLTKAVTETAQKLQQREAELTKAISVLLERIRRLSEHNRWLSETIMDELGNSEPERLISSVIQRLQQIEDSIQNLMPEQNGLIIANEARPQIVGLRAQAPAPLSIEPGLSAACHRNLNGRTPWCRYQPKQKRVLMVAPSLARGGAERQILATADGLLRRGYEVEIFYFADLVGEANFIDEFSQLGINCHHPSKFRSSIVDEHKVEDIYGLRQFAQIVDQLDIDALGRALANAIRQFRPAIVHCWSDLANVIGGLVATTLGVPTVVLGQRNVPAFRHIEGVAPYLCLDAYRLLAQRPNVIMLNNSAAGAAKYMHCLGVPHHKISVIYNGFLPRGIHIRRRSETQICRHRLGLADDVPVIGTVMRFAPEKDPHLWLATAAAIAAGRPNSQFVLAGYGNLAKQIERKIETLGLAERFILPGATKDVGLIYGALDVLLLTSRYEGTPNVLIEAQAAGVPVVAPDVGGTSEALLDGITGILVGHRRASNLASAVLEILEEPRWRERASSEGPAFAWKRFGHKRMIDETIAAYGLKENCAENHKLHKPIDIKTAQDSSTPSKADDHGDSRLWAK